MSHPPLQSAIVPGKPVTTLVPQILSLLPVIASMTVVRYRPAPVLAERLQQQAKPLPEVVTRATSLHDAFGIGYWDAVLAMELKQGKMDDQFIDLALVHDWAPDEHEITLKREEITSEHLEELIDSTPVGYGVALSSRMVLIDGSEAHLPMLDFRCPHSAEAIPFLKRALLVMGQKTGVLVQSPRSYHYYGLELVSREGLTKFLAQALLMAPVVDARYVAHRLLDGACRLRLGAVQNKGAAPVIAGVIHETAASR